MKKQTAVEWLVKKLKDNGVSFMSDELYLIEQAKEMEGEHIKNAYDHMRCIGNHENGEEYYKETYGGEKPLRQPAVIKSVCVCKNRQDQFKRGDAWICGDCEEEIKQTVL